MAAKLHPSFARALEAASLPREEHGAKRKATIPEPGHGWHLGEPLALSIEDHLRVAIWVGRREIALLFDGHPPDEDPNEHRFRQLETWLSSEKPPTLEEVIAFESSSAGNSTTRRMLSAAKEIWGGGKKARAEALLRDAIGRATPSAYDEGGVDGARAWLADLDLAMMRTEMRALVRPLDPEAAARIERVVFRASKPVEARLAQLGGGRFGAWVKAARKSPTWAEGSRAEVLAALPASVAKAAAGA